MELTQTTGVLNGGVMTMLPISEPQFIYLDFDGELTSYNGEILTIDNVAVEDSGLTAGRIAQITQALNERFAGQNVRFVSDKSDLSDQSDYSTIYVGKTSSFEPYGTFAGLAETVDSGNKIRNDNAFVILDFLSSNDRIASVIAHEAGHLIGTLDHGENGLKRYAAGLNDVCDGTTSSYMEVKNYVSVYAGGLVRHPIVSSGGYLAICKQGSATDAIILSSGHLYVSSGGVVSGVTAGSSGYVAVLSGGKADNIRLQKGNIEAGGSLLVKSCGIASNITAEYYTRVSVEGGGFAKHLTISSGATLNLFKTGKIGGSILIESGAKVVSFQGALDFTVAEQTNPNTALLNNWLAVADISSYTLTINVGQAAGKYILAQKASAFSSVIALRDTTGTEYDNIALDEPLTRGGYTYLLSCTNGNLTFEISGGTPQPAQTADLTVASLTPSASTVTGSQSVTLNFIVQNSGTAYAGASTAYIYDGTTKLGNVSVSALSAGATSQIYSYTIAAGTLTAGTHTLKVVADGAGVIAESNENNNSTSCSVTVNAVTANPDLTVASLTPSASTVTGSQSVTLNFVVQNSGTAYAGASTAYIYDGTTKLGNVSVSALYAGATSQICSYTIAAGTLTAGTHTLKVVADGAGVIAESNENNNSTSCSVTVNAVTANPDLTVASLTPSASTVTGSQSVTLNFVVQNSGTAYAGASTAYIYDGTTKLGNVSVSALYAGATSQIYSYTIAAGTLTAGTHTLKVVADGAGVIAESNENNNSTSCNVTVNAVTTNPDLCVDMLDTSAGTVTTAQPVTLNFSVRNSGTAYAGASTAYIYDGTIKLGDVSIAALAAGTTSQVYTYTISAGTLAAGTHILSVIADGAGVIAESNEDNNGTSCYVFVDSAASQADLTVSSVTTPASIITTAQPVTLNFTIANIGAGASEMSSACIYDGQKLIDFVSVPVISAGGSLSKSYTIKAGTLSAGIHTLRVVADGTDLVAETNENNNGSSCYIIVNSATPQPDLTVASLDSTIKIFMHSLALNFVIQNNGSANAGASAAWIYDGDTKLGTVSVAALASGASASYTYNLSLDTLGAGTHILKVVADGAEAVAESDESNNSATCTVTVSDTKVKPDLSVASLSASASTITAGQPVTLNFTVQNSGTVSAVSSTAYVYDGSTKLGNVSVAALSAGASSQVYTYTIAAGRLSAGTHTLKVVADGAGVVEESNENNNSSTCLVSVTGSTVESAQGDLDGNGLADIVMTIDQSTHPYNGATGAWLIQGNQIPAWGDLSTRNNGWSIFGTGWTSAKANADVYIKSTGNIVGAWVTDSQGKVSGWETIGDFGADAQVLGLGDFNGDGQSDILLRNTNGAVGCYFTSGEGWNYFQSLGNEWKLCGIGDLNGDGLDDVVLKHNAGFAGTWLTQSDGTIAWADLDTLQNGFEIVGCGDFNGDGVDDVLLQNGSYFGAWIVENGSVSGWMGLGSAAGTVEQIADFNGDGTDDLRVRSSNGAIGSLLVKGADTLEWKYYGSVGNEWSTSLAAL